MINQFLCTAVIIIRMDRHNVTYTRVSNIKDSFSNSPELFFTPALMSFSGSSYLIRLNFKITVTYVVQYI